MMKPWELSPGGVDAPAPLPTQLAPAASGKADRQVKAGGPQSHALTPDEWKQYFETSRRIAEARVAAENFERAMRRDFAERRLKKLQQA